MEINNKFNINDEVFFYCGHGLKRGIVKNMDIIVSNEIADGYRIEYGVLTDGEICYRMEKTLFPTVGEALDDLRRRYEASQGK